MLLEELVGQPQAVTILQRAIAAKRVPHAYLFEGPPGVGKRSAAVGLAMALNCEAPTPVKSPAEEPTPAPPSGCGTCESCRRIAGGLHPDVVIFAPDGSQIVMDQAQEIVALGQRRPHEGRVRVVIVDAAEALNASASNCLLKTLEEPSPGTHFVLVTTAPDRLLGTIRSRTQRVRFGRVPVADLHELGARRGRAGSNVQAAAIVADGSVARFLALTADAEDQGTRDAALVLLAAARGRGIACILDAAVGVGDKDAKHRLPEVLSLLARIYRDALVTAVGAPELAAFGHAAGDSGDAEEIVAGPSARSVRKDQDGPPPREQDFVLPTNLPVPALGRALSAFVEAETALAGNVNAVMAVERLLLNLRREERVTQ